MVIVVVFLVIIVVILIVCKKKLFLVFLFVLGLLNSVVYEKFSEYLFWGMKFVVKLNVLFDLLYVIGKIVKGCNLVLFMFVLVLLLRVSRRFCLFL